MAIAGILDFPASTSEPIRLAFYPASPVEGARQIPVLVHSLSPSGMLIECDHLLQLADTIETAFADTAVTLGSITWTGEGLFGCQFADRVAVDVLERAFSRTIDDERTVESLSDPVETFGARLQRLRKAKGIPQIDIAERLGVSAVAISNWESDRSQPRRHRMVELAKILGVPYQELDINTGMLADALPEVLATSRAQIGSLIGVSPDRVTITVNL
jgi:transcriptional regulator with XRE-family HTH domain